MKTKELLLICIIFLLVENIYGQEKYYGITTGLVTDGLFNKYNDELFTKEDLLIRLQAEYYPKKAMFSITAGIQYFSKNESVMVPLNLNLLFGKKIKLKVIVGLIPFYRLNPFAPNKTFGIGEQVGIGVENKINKKYVMFTDFSVYFIPELRYHPSHFGNTYIDRDIKHFRYLNIGIKYLIQKKEQKTYKQKEILNQTRNSKPSV